MATAAVTIATRRKNAWLLELVNLTYVPFFLMKTTCPLGHCVRLRPSVAYGLRAGSEL
jgi:hypothetical protein